MRNNTTISNTLLAAVDRLAEQLEISRNDVIRRALERYLEQESAPAPALVAATRSARNDEDW